MCQVDVVGLVAALAFQLFEHVAHDFVLFGVHGHDAAVLGDLAEHLPQMAGRNTDLHRSEHLEAPDSLLERLGDFADRQMSARPGQNVVKRIVRITMIPKDGPPTLQHVEQRPTPFPA